jgi:Protein of unknown function (DUF2946)
MPTMNPASRHLLQGLRQARHLTRWVLVWFALSLGVAIAAPLLNPQAMELICSSSGVMKVLIKNGDGSTSEAMARMADCPLCATLAGPPPAGQSSTEPAQPLAHVLQTIPAAIIAALTAAPPPARGPPAFS